MLLKHAKSQCPLILKIPFCPFIPYQGTNAAVDLVPSLVLLISFPSVLRKKQSPVFNDLLHQ